MGSQIAQVSPSTQPQGKAGAAAISQYSPVQQANLFQPTDMRYRGGEVAQKPMDFNPAGELRPSPPIGGITPDYMTMSPAGQSTNQPQQGLGKGGRVTTPGQGGQPRMGVPNNYSNTVGQWDNASIQPRQTQSGKGKGY